MADSAYSFYVGIDWATGAVIQPDGTVAVPQAWVLADERGRVAEARINRGSGAVRFEDRVTDGEAAAPEPDEEPEVPEPPARNRPRRSPAENTLPDKGSEGNPS